MANKKTIADLDSDKGLLPSAVFKMYLVHQVIQSPNMSSLTRVDLGLAINAETVAKVEDKRQSCPADKEIYIVFVVYLCKFKEA